MVYVSKNQPITEALQMAIGAWNGDPEMKLKREQLDLERDRNDALIRQNNSDAALKEFDLENKVGLKDVYGTVYNPVTGRNELTPETASKILQLTQNPEMLNLDPNLADSTRMNLGLASGRSYNEQNAFSPEGQDTIAERDFGFQKKLKQMELDGQAEEGVLFGEYLREAMSGERRDPSNMAEALNTGTPTFKNPRTEGKPYALDGVVTEPMNLADIERAVGPVDSVKPKITPVTGEPFSTPPAEAETGFDRADQIGNAMLYWGLMTGDEKILRLGGTFVDRAARSEERQTTREAAKTQKIEAALPNFINDIGPYGDIAYSAAGAADMLAKYPEGTDIPGVGSVLDNLKLESMRTPEEIDVRNAIQQTGNKLGLIRGGKALTSNEISLIAREMGFQLRTDGTFALVNPPSDTQLRKGLNRLNFLLDKEIKNRFAGYSPEVVQTYKERGGPYDPSVLDGKFTDPGGLGNEFQTGPTPDDIDNMSEEELDAFNARFKNGR